RSPRRRASPDRSRSTRRSAPIGGRTARPRQTVAGRTETASAPPRSARRGPVVFIGRGDPAGETNLAGRGRRAEGGSGHGSGPVRADRRRATVVPRGRGPTGGPAGGPRVERRDWRDVTREEAERISKSWRSASGEVRGEV